MERLERKKNYPGAGTYDNVLSFDKEGRYQSSTFTNSKSARWAKDEKLKPPISTHLAVPGPGEYDHVGNTSTPT